MTLTLSLSKFYIQKLLLLLIVISVTLSGAEESKSDWTLVRNEAEFQFIKNAFESTFPDGKCKILGYQQFAWVNGDNGYFQSGSNPGLRIIFPKSRANADILVLESNGLAPDSLQYQPFAPMAGTKTYLVLRNEGADVFSAILGYKL